MLSIPPLSTRNSVLLKYSQMYYAMRKTHGVLRTSVTQPDIEKLMHVLDRYSHRIESALSAEPATVRVNSVTARVICATGHSRIAVGTYSSSIESGTTVTIDGARGGASLQKGPCVFAEPRCV